MGTEVGAESRLVNPGVNVRLVLAALWVCHFILWIFGDMFSLLQEMDEPVTGTAIQYLAPSTAIVLTLMVVFNLIGPPAQARVANVIVGSVYVLLDLGFIVDATEGWEYYLGTFYVLFGAAIVWRAITWPRAGAARARRAGIRRATPSLVFMMWG